MCSCAGKCRYKEMDVQINWLGRDLGVVAGSIQGTVGDVFVRLWLSWHHLHH